MFVDGPLIKHILAVRRIKQWQICRKADISETYFSRIMQGKVGISEKMAKKIADAIGVSVEKIVIKEHAPVREG